MPFLAGVESKTFPRGVRVRARCPGIQHRHISEDLRRNFMPMRRDWCPFTFDAAGLWDCGVVRRSPRDGTDSGRELLERPEQTVLAAVVEGASRSS